MKTNSPVTRSTKRKWNYRPLIVLGGLLALIGAILLTYLVVQSQPQPVPQKYYIYGGFANSFETTDPHLITLLNEQTEIIDTVNNTYTIGGLSFNNQVLSTTLPESEITPATRVRIALVWDMYFPVESNSLEDIQQTIISYLETNGYMIMEGDTLNDHALTLQREVTVTNNVTGEEETKIEFTTLFMPEAYIDEGYYMVHVEMFSNIHYQLGAVPTWSGILRNDENKKKWGWVLENPSAEKYCEVEPNTVIGFWDSSFECLQNIVDPSIYDDEHDH